MEHTLRRLSAFTLRPAVTTAPLLRLRAGSALAGRLPAGACIAVHSGRVWLTQSGDANDYLVDAGHRHVLSRGGRVVVESFTAQATLRVLRGPAAARPGFP